MISIIVAMGRNRVIGKDNDLIWHLPADLNHFKKITMGKPVIMGRKTFESMGRPLPGRINVVVTRNRQFNAPACLPANSLEKALELVSEGKSPVRAPGDNSATGTSGEKEIFIAGGAEIYRQAIPLADRMYITIVDHEFEGDTFFPEFTAGNWKMVEEKKHPADKRNKYPMLFRTYVRV